MMTSPMPQPKPHLFILKCKPRKIAEAVKGCPITHEEHYFGPTQGACRLVRNRNAANPHESWTWHMIPDDDLEEYAGSF